MIKVVFIEHDGNSHEVNAYAGESLMEAAVSNNVPGIDADCGGNCACATCHVFVDPEWISKVGERREMENSMLEFSENLKPTSRLSCQIEVSEELNGLVVELPEAQY